MCDTKTKTTCPYCGVGCGIDVESSNKRQVSIEGDRQHPANHGRLCSKGTHLAETVGLEGRLLYPMIGQRTVGWDSALDDVASRMRDTVEQYGPDSVAFYLSGQLLTEDYYVANKLAKGFVGTGNIDTNSRLCMASAVAAHNRAFGEDVVPCSYADLDEADLVILVGSNTAWCHPVAWQRIEKARERRGTKIIVVDPRRTETAAMADLHIPLPPDGDIALFNALLAEMIDRGRLDGSFLDDHCTLPEGFLDALDPAAHDIDPAVFNELAELVDSNSRMVTLFSQGANQSVCGTDKGNAIINLHLAMGRIGRPGAGPFSMTGQPNAMGGREVGGLANILACHLGFSEAERASVADFWQTSRLCSGPGLKAVDLFRAVHAGKVKFVWIMATNPAVSMPDAGFVREALARCPNVIVSDIIADTDTAKLAHVRLPALGWGEKDGTVTNSERCISRQRAFMARPGKARADWKIVCDVAARLGHGQSFDFESPADVFREYSEMTVLATRHGKLLDLSNQAGITDKAYDRMQPFQWGGARPFEHGFSTASGKANIVAVSPSKARGAGPSLALNTGRYRDQWHTMTRTGLSARLSAHRPEPLLEIAPADGEAHGLSDGGLAHIETTAGRSAYRVAFNEDQRAGEIFAPMHWTDANSGAGRTGLLVHPECDPVSGQPGFKNVPAQIAPYNPDWRAFLLSRKPVRPEDAGYWVRSRIDGGWFTELAGDGAINVDKLLPPGERSEVCDLVRGMRRILVAGAGSAPEALLYVTRSGEIPHRDWLVRQFAQTECATTEWLAGRPSSPQPDTGPLVCVCYDIGENAVRQAVDNGAASVAEVGARISAGTNCGSCRPLIARIIQEHSGALREAAV